jgi:hypothetical protein
MALPWLDGAESVGAAIDFASAEGVPIRRRPAESSAPVTSWIVVLRRLSPWERRGNIFLTLGYLAMRASSS